MWCHRSHSGLFWMSLDKNLAERVGFEPTYRDKPVTRFRVERVTAASLPLRQLGLLRYPQGAGQVKKWAGTGQRSTGQRSTGQRRGSVGQGRAAPDSVAPDSAEPGSAEPGQHRTAQGRYSVASRQPRFRRKAQGLPVRRPCRPRFGPWASGIAWISRVFSAPAPGRGGSFAKPRCILIRKSLFCSKVRHPTTRT